MTNVCHILDDETLYTTQMVVPTLKNMNVYIGQINGWTFKLMRTLPITNNNIILVYDTTKTIVKHKVDVDCYCKSIWCIPYIEHNLKNNLYKKLAIIIVHFVNDIAEIKSLIQNSSYSIINEYIESNLYYYKIISS